MTTNFFGAIVVFFKPWNIIIYKNLLIYFVFKNQIFQFQEIDFDLGFHIIKDTLEFYNFCILDIAFINKAKKKNIKKCI